MARIPKISYSDDEVRVFHKHVENRLKKYMENNGLDSKYEMRHHPEGIVRTVPDFVILDKPSGKWLFVIEVKRTPGSTRSVRTWDQARSYVKNNKSVHWSPINKPYFMVTNIELSYFLCDRADSATQFCLLKNGEEMCADFGNNADRTLNDFETKVIPRIFQQIRNQDEEYSENLKLLLDEFAGLQSALSSYITNIVKNQIGKTPNSFGFQNIKNYNDQLSEWQRLNDPRASEINYEKLAREITRDCLLRIFLYEYCREIFKANAIHTLLRPIKMNSQKDLETSLKTSLENLEKIDFSQIIKTRLIEFVPENMDHTSFKFIEAFLTKIQQHMTNAIKENGSPAYLLNLIMENEKFYSWEESNGDGKIMTDPDLADFVSALCFDTISEKSRPSIYDPGCGTGNLLSSCYDKIKHLHPQLSHNEILSCLHGSEVDAFLGKLGVFGLIMKSPKEISNKTEIEISLNDFFETIKQDLKKHDIVVMNPPFLRNDNKISVLQRKIIEEKILRISGEESMIASVSQPNLFYYFIESATSLLKNHGVCGYFIMASVLNTTNGIKLKQFLLDNFEIRYVIMCPRTFFRGYKVSPCIFIGVRKDNPDIKNKITFARVFSSKFFTSNYKSVMKTQTQSNGEFKMLQVEQAQLKADDDWKRFLLSIPSFYDVFKVSEKFVPIKEAFGKVKRGKLANQGNGSQFFFPWSNSKVKKTIGDKIDNIENKFKNFGLEHSRIQQNYILTESDLTKEPCLSITGSTNISKYPGLNRFIKTFDSNYVRPNRWQVDNMDSQAQIVIPRASRKIHSVLFNPFWNKNKVYFSSNFVCLWDCNIKIKGMSNHEIVKFVAGFLNSSFGQIMFEIECQDREGLRKIEKGTVSEKILLPFTELDECKSEIKIAIEKFEKLEYGLTGIEDNKSRNELDLSIAKILWDIEPDFHKVSESPEELAVQARNNLRELVSDRL